MMSLKLTWWIVLLVVAFIWFNIQTVLLPHYRNEETVVYKKQDQQSSLRSPIITEGQLDRAQSHLTALNNLVNLVKNGVQQNDNHRGGEDSLRESTDNSGTVTPDSVSPSDIRNSAWSSQLQAKIECLNNGLLEGIFLYHIRKAAGTSVRDMLTEATSKWKIPLYETEGPSLNQLFLNENLLFVTSIRDPIERILSLYW